MKKASLLILMAAGLVFFSCSTALTNNNSMDNAESMRILQTSKWFLDDADGISQSTGGKPLSLGFTTEDGILRANGFAGCNNYFGEVKLDGTSINFDKMGATMMACPDMEKEDAFMKLLPQVNNYSISGNKLTLYKDKIALMNFVKAQR